MRISFVTPLLLALSAVEISAQALPSAPGSAATAYEIYRKSFKACADDLTAKQRVNYRYYCPNDERISECLDVYDANVNCSPFADLEKLMKLLDRAKPKPRVCKAAPRPSARPTASALAPAAAPIMPQASAILGEGPVDDPTGTPPASPQLEGQSLSGPSPNPSGQSILPQRGQGPQLPSGGLTGQPTIPQRGQGPAQVSGAPATTTLTMSICVEFLQAKYKTTYFYTYCVGEDEQMLADCRRMYDESKGCTGFNDLEKMLERFDKMKPNPNPKACPVSASASLTQRSP